MPEPKKGFDPDAYLQKKEVEAQPEFKQEEFNPDAFLAKDQAQANPDTVVGGMLRHAAKGAAWGYSPQIKGLLSGGSIGDQSYLSARDAETAQLEEFAQRHPYLAKGSEIAGNIATTVLPGGLIGKALGGAGKAAVVASEAPELAGTFSKLGGLIKGGAKLAATGSAQEAAYNPGDTAGKIDLLQPEARVEGAERGAAGGLLGGAIGKVVGKGVGSLAPSALDEKASKLAFRSLGAKTREINNLFKYADKTDLMAKPKDIGKFALDKNIITFGDDIGKIAENASKVRDDLGKQIGESYKRVSALTNDPEKVLKLSPFAQDKLASSALNPKNLSDEFINFYKNKTALEEPLAQRFLPAVEQAADNFKKKGQFIDPAGMHEWINKLQGTVNWTENDKPTQEGIKAFRRFLVNKLQDHYKAIDEAFGTKETKNLLKLNKEFSAAADLDNLASHKLARETANNIMSLRDNLAATEVLGQAAGELMRGNIKSAALGVPLTAGAGLLSNISRKYSAPASAAVSNAAAKGFGAVGGLLPEMTLPKAAKRAGSAALGSGLLRGERDAKK